MARSPMVLLHAHVPVREPAAEVRAQPADEVQTVRDDAARQPDAVSMPRIAIRRGPTLNQPWFYNALVAVLAAWVLHSFVEALLAAAVIAIASWPLHMRFVNRVGPRLPRGATSLVFTSAMTVFVLAPMIFAFVALITEAQALGNDIVSADRIGISAPRWLGDLPAVGGWLANRWEDLLDHPGALVGRTEQADPAVLFAWAQQMVRITGHHALTIGFTILLLFFLYRKGELIADELRRVLRESFVDAERYLDVATRAVQGALNSMIIVGLCDGLAATVAFALLGVPHAALWAAIIGSLALIPFLGYLGVIVLACQLAMKGAAALALLSLGFGAAILLFGDKILRPMVAHDKVLLPFVWFLMGCLGGFEVLGPVGLVVGPVVLTIARELWVSRDCADRPLSHAVGDFQRHSG